MADRSLGIPGGAREAFQLLGASELLAGPLAERLAAAVGLRNRIAHQYQTLDLDRVDTIAREDLGDLEDLARAVAELYGIAG